VEKWGLTDEGVWHVTALAQGGSLDGIVRRKGGRNDAALRHVVHSLAAGCLALKQETGLCHGNLKVSNVLLAKKGVRLRKTPLLLTDSYPACSGVLRKRTPFFASRTLLTLRL